MRILAGRCLAGRGRDGTALLAALVALASAVAVLASCGVPSDPGPRSIPEDRVPFGLLADDTVPSTTTTPAGSTTVTVYFVEGERLLGVSRDVTEPVTAESLLAALLAGPTAQEAERGLLTAIPPAAAVTSTGVVGSQAQLELSRSFADVSGPNQVLAIAQIVYTVTALPGIDQATFTLEGRAVEVPAGGGTLKSGPLMRGDFPTVAPP